MLKQWFVCFFFHHGLKQSVILITKPPIYFKSISGVEKIIVSSSRVENLNLRKQFAYSGLVISSDWIRNHSFNKTMLRMWLYLEFKSVIKLSWRTIEPNYLARVSKTIDETMFGGDLLFIAGHWIYLRDQKSINNFIYLNKNTAKHLIYDWKKELNKIKPLYI